MTRRAALLLTFALVAAGCHRGTPAAASPRSPYVYLVRHAEKAPAPPNDPVLSEAGQARARALDALLGTQPVQDVVVSHLQRTRLTAAPFITRSGAVVHVVPIGAGGASAHIAAVADTVRAIAAARGRGGILVVGHSNTVTQIVTALGAGSPPELCDSQYSQLFRVDLATRTLTRSTYGAADPADSTCAQSLPGMLTRP